MGCVPSSQKMDSKDGSRQPVVHKGSMQVEEFAIKNPTSTATAKAENNEDKFAKEMVTPKNNGLPITKGGQELTGKDEIEKKIEKTETTKKSEDDTLNNLLMKKPLGEQQTTQLYLFNPKYPHNEAKIFNVSHTPQVESPYSSVKDWDRIIKKQGEKDTEGFMLDILQLPNRNWYNELIKGTGEKGRHFVSFSSTKCSQRLQEHFNWLAWALTKYLFQSASLYMPSSGDKKLPPRDSKDWREGFRWKGIFIKQMTTSEAYYIKNELLGQKYIAIELAEMACKAEKDGECDVEGTAGMFLRNCILPIISMATYGPEVIVVSPCICIPTDCEQEEEALADLSNSQDYAPGANNEAAKQNISKIHNMSSHFLNLHQSNASFSFWGGDATFIQESALKTMPMLSKLASANIIPVINPDSATDPDAMLKYLIVNTYSMIPPAQEEPSYFMRVPWDSSSYIDVFDKVNQTNFSAAALASMMGHEKLVEESDNGASFIQKSQISYLSIYGWDVQIRSFKHAEPLENKRLNSLFKTSCCDKPSDIQGNGLLACNYFKNASRSKYPLIARLNTIALGPASNLNYNAITRKCVNCVAVELSTNENYSNVTAMKELLHRKGLSLRYEWIVLSQIPSTGKNATVLCLDLLAHALKKVVNLNSAKSYNNKSKESIEVSYKNMLSEYVNAILKVKGKNSERIIDEIFQALFFSRLRIIKEANAVILTENDRSYLQGKEIVQFVFQAGRQNPSLLLETIETCMGVTFDKELLRKARADKFSFLKEKMPVPCQYINSVNVKVMCGLCSKEYSYLALAKLMFEDEFEEKKRITNPESLRKLYKRGSSSSYKVNAEQPPVTTERAKGSSGKSMAQETKNNSYLTPSIAENYKSTRDILPNKTIGKSASKPPLNPSTDNKKRSANISTKQMEERKGVRSATSDEELKYDLTDDCRSNRLKEFHKQVTGLIPNRVLKGDIGDINLVEIIFPSTLYQVNSETQKDTSNMYVLKHFYEFPKHEILEEWIHFNEMLLSELPTVDGSQRLILEGSFLLLLSCMFKEKDMDLALKIISRMREYLCSNIKWPQETVLMCLTLLAISVEIEQGLSKAGNIYVSCMLLYLQLYGDPRGRGHCAVPWGLLLAFKLKKCAELENRIMDIAYMEELYEAMRFSLTSSFNESVSNEEIAPAEIHVDVKEGESSEHHEDLESEQRAVDHIKILSTMFTTGTFSQEFFMWLLNYNPSKYEPRTMWSNWKIKEILEIAQLIRPSKSPMKNGTPARDKKLFAQQTMNYWQIFSQETFAISKTEMKGIVYSWGSDKYGQLGFNNGEGIEDRKFLYPTMCIPLKDIIIKDIACSHSCSFAIDVYGVVFGWGNNDFGQLGLGDLAPKKVLVPQIIKGLPNNVAKIACGNEHTIALCSSGELYSWGHGDCGLPGHGDNTSHKKPKRIEELKKRVAMVSCGGLHTIAVCKDGGIYSWGKGEGGQLGLPEAFLDEQIAKNKDCSVNKPTQITAEALKEKVVQDISCGEAHTLLLTQNGEVYGWGFSNYGQLGLGCTSDTFEPGTGNYNSQVCEPTLISALNGTIIKQIIAGSTFSLFISDKHELYGCGMNDLCQIGAEIAYRELNTGTKQSSNILAYNGANAYTHTTDIPTPLPVLCFSGIPISNIAAGESHSIAITENPPVIWAWGDYKYGQLGIGEVGKASNPRPIQAFNSAFISHIACGGSHSMAVVGDSKSATSKRREVKAENSWDMRTNSSLLALSKETH